jgi:glycosyltransferase involved in cell wall biosynthesis
MRARPDLVVMEGTGAVGGIAALLLKALLGVPFIVSTGDAVGPFLSARYPAFGLLGHVYERLLYRSSHGVIAWTPYLAGRALTFGARRTVTIPGWLPPDRNQRASGTERAYRRRKLDIGDSTLVVGIVGSLRWNSRREYCYGLELVRAIRMSQRADVAALIVGDGDGRERLIAAAGDDFGSRILLPGYVGREEVLSYLAAMDIASLPQSVDGVGSFRYTTKLVEYVAAGLPIVTGQIPASYDLDDGRFYRLPGDLPWGDDYVRALAELLDSLDHKTLFHAGNGTALIEQTFNAQAQQERLANFISDICTSLRS